MADHAHHDDHGHDSGFHASMKDYVIGFVLSVILTAIPFWLVMTGALHSPPPRAWSSWALPPCRSWSTWSTSCT
jgi:hypothetical protein